MLFVTLSKTLSLTTPFICFVNLVCMSTLGLSFFISYKIIHSYRLIPIGSIIILYKLGLIFLAFIGDFTTQITVHTWNCGKKMKMIWQYLPYPPGPGLFQLKLKTSIKTLLMHTYYFLILITIYLYSILWWVVRKSYYGVSHSASVSARSAHDGVCMRSFVCCCFW